MPPIYAAFVRAWPAAKVGFAFERAETLVGRFQGEQGEAEGGPSLTIARVARPIPA